MKTKFFILGTIVSLLSIGTFTSAVNYNGTSFSCSLGGEIDGYNQCDDDYLIFEPYLEGDYVLSASSSISFNATVLVENGSFDESSNILSPGIFPGTYNIHCGDGGCQNINVYNYYDIDGTTSTTPALLTFSISSNGGEGGVGGGEGGESTGGIIANGVGAFSGIITKLTEISGEFIPYIIYIAIALLGISLTINVVKYILGYLKGGAENSITGREGMKARRKRRRQQRRKTYSYEDVKRAKRKSDYYDIGNGRYKRRTIQRRKKFGYGI